MSNLIQQFHFTPQLACERLICLRDSQFFKNTRKLLEDHYKSIRGSLVFSYSTKKVQKTELHCCQKPKNLILGPFLGLFGVS